jgi:hypothetical protein
MFLLPAEVVPTAVVAPVGTAFMDSSTVAMLISLAINGLIGFGTAWIAFKTKSLEVKTNQIAASQIVMTTKVADLETNTNSKMDKLIQAKEAESTAKQHAAGLEGELRGRDQVATVVPAVVVAEKAAVYELTQQDITEFKTLIERMTAKKNG